MKTTLEVPDDLFREAKAKAALEGIRLKDMVARALEREVRGEGSARPPAPEPSLVRRRAGQRTEFPLLQPGKRPFPYLTNALIEEIFAEEDAEYYGRFLRR